MKWMRRCIFGPMNDFKVCFLGSPGNVLCEGRAGTAGGRRGRCRLPAAGGAYQNTQHGSYLYTILNILRNVIVSGQTSISCHTRPLILNAMVIDKWGGEQQSTPYLADSSTNGH